MKKTLIWIVVPILLAIVCVVGTLAYFIDEEKAENVMTVGNIGIQIVEYERESTSVSNAAATVRDFNNDKLLIPSTAPDDFDYTALDNTTYVDWAQVGKTGYTSPIWDPTKVSNEVDKMVFVENTGDYDAYVRLYFAFEAGNFVRLNRFKEMVHLNLDTANWTWEWLDKANHVADIGGEKYFIATATCNVPVKAGELSPISLSQIALDSTAKNGDSLAFGEKYDVWVFAQGVQADGFQDFGYTPATALTEAFGTTVPFDGVTYVPLTDLATALHYLDADTSKTKLVGTDSVSNNMVNSVTFSTLKARPEIAGAHTGVFTANKVNEADFTAYTYYVQNDAGKYDIYVLSCGDTVYAPKSCGSLFLSMSSLTTVDTSNLDVSQTTSMYRMFYKCHSLNTIDVSEWDMSNVASIAGMFFECRSLVTLEVDDWFADGPHGTVGVEQAFYGCKALKSLELSNWNIKVGTSIRQTFKECIALSGKLDLTGWDVSNVTTMYETFCDCSKLTEIDVSTWDVGSVNTFELMFDDCHALKELDIANWDVSSATSFHGMFRYCISLKEIELSEWNVEKLNSALGMFVGCGSLTSLDLSGWNTANLVKTGQMFSKCGNLKTIYVGKDIWNMESVTDSANMFEQCEALVGGKGTKFSSSNPTDKTYARIDGGESNPGYLTEK